MAEEGVQFPFGRGCLWGIDREGEMQRLAVLAKRFWVRPRTVWKWGARCGGERADVLDPHGQHLMQLGCGFMEVLHPAWLAWKQSLTKKGGCAPAGRGS